MSVDSEITEHYRHGELLDAILSGVRQLGKAVAGVSIEDLAPVDEFHIGGRRASGDFLDQLNISAGQHFLDIGCGLGGTSRFVVDRYKCHVNGIDLCPEYIETGQELNNWVGLQHHIDLRQGSALSLEFDDSSFDGAYMMHVGMNIRDKEALFAEIFRVLRPGALFGIYDVMQVGDGELTFPIPWATAPSTSALETPVCYRTALQSAGFTIQVERDRRDFAIDFFRQLRQKSASLPKRPALGLHILMGDTAALKVKNMVENISSGKIAPVELIVKKD